MLSKRLARLVEEGMLEKRQYEERPPRYEYRLTDKGRAFWDVLAAMWRWGMDWQWTDDDPPLVLLDRETGAEVRPVVVDERTGDRSTCGGSGSPRTAVPPDPRPSRTPPC